MKRNLVQALKKLLVAFGGAKNTSEVTDTNIVPIVDKLADAVGEFTPNGGNGNIKYLLEPQTITTTGNETELIQLVGLMPSLYFDEDKAGSMSESEIVAYLNNNIVVKINGQRVFYNNQRVSLSYMDNLTAWFLTKDNISCGIIFPVDIEDDQTAIWFTMAGSGFDGEHMSSATPVAAEYTIEVYEILENKTTINLPEPSEENVGQVLTSIETDEDTYAFGFTTPTSGSDDAFIININQYATTPTTNNMMGITFDKTFEEISAAFAAGKRIYAKNHKAYYNPSFIYQGTTLISIHIRWYQQMLEDNRPDKHIIFYEINDDDRAITSYIYKIEAIMYQEGPTIAS